MTSARKRKRAVRWTYEQQARAISAWVDRLEARQIEFARTLVQAGPAVNIAREQWEKLGYKIKARELTEKYYPGRRFERSYPYINDGDSVAGKCFSRETGTWSRVFINDEIAYSGPCSLSAFFFPTAEDFENAYSWVAYLRPDWSDETSQVIKDELGAWVRAVAEYAQ